MAYLLDTNVCIRFIKGQNIKLATRFSETPAERKIICSVVRAELYYGAYRSTRIDDTLQKLDEFLSCFPNLAFDNNASKLFGKIRADLHKKGTPIGPYDLQIAAIALANNHTLITHNFEEFSRVDDLRIEDWEQ